MTPGPTPVPHAPDQGTGSRRLSRITARALAWAARPGSTFEAAAVIGVVVVAGLLFSGNMSAGDAAEIVAVLVIAALVMPRVLRST